EARKVLETSADTARVETLEVLSGGPLDAFGLGGRSALPQVDSARFGQRAVHDRSEVHVEAECPAALPRQLSGSPGGADPCRRAERNRGAQDGLQAIHGPALLVEAQHGRPRKALQIRRQGRELRRRLDVPPKENHAPGRVAPQDLALRVLERLPGDANGEEPGRHSVFRRPCSAASRASAPRGVICSTSTSRSFSRTSSSCAVKSSIWPPPALSPDCRARTGAPLTSSSCFSRLPRISRARAVTTAGSPASSATWI